MQCSYVKDSFLSSGSELNMEMTCKNSAHQEAHKTAGTSNTSKLVKLNSQMEIAPAACAVYVLKWNILRGEAACMTNRKRKREILFKNIFQR